MRTGRPAESANQARMRLWGRIMSGERRMLGPDRGTPSLRALLLYLAWIRNNDDPQAIALAPKVFIPSGTSGRVGSNNALSNTS
jgi:hypothetical protein